MDITDDMMRDIAADLGHGATWVSLGLAYGIAPRTLHRAYGRKCLEAASREKPAAPRGFLTSFESAMLNRPMIGRP